TAHNNGMVEIARRVSETGANIGGFEVGIILKNFLLGSALGEHVEHVLHPDAHAAHARASAALFWIYRDSFGVACLGFRAVVHAGTIGLEAFWHKRLPSEISPGQANTGCGPRKRRDDW